MTDTDREAFEAWWATMNEAPYYEGIQERVALNAWQAATQRQQSRIAELEAEVQALRKDAEWLPIETAPEAPVILYFPAFGVSRGKLKPTLSPMIRIGCVSETPNRTPTHWKPLPPAPSAAMNKEGARE